MKAAYYEQKGDAGDVLVVGEMEDPRPRSGEVLVRISVSAVNPSDTKSRSGFGGNMKMPFPRIIPHQDGAGVIEAVGEGVDPSRIGQRVWIYEATFGRPFGTAAELCCVPSGQAIDLPDHVDFETGACLGIPAMTAHRCLLGDGPVAGKVVLIHGGGGFVSSIALQLAKWAGAKQIIATVSREEQRQVATASGATDVINYKSEDVVERIAAMTRVKSARGVDHIVDVNLQANVQNNGKVLKPNCVMSTYSPGNTADAEISFLGLPMLMHGHVIRFVLVYVMPEEAKRDAIADITAALNEHAIRPNIARRFSLDEIAAAHDAQDGGEMIGKALIQMTPTKP